MTRVLLFLAAAALAASPPDPRAEATAVRLDVRPMPAPRPALKYQLLPGLEELNPGNAAQNYLKCFMEQRIFFFSRESIAERARYQAMPLAELPADQLSGYGGSALRQADWAARLDTLDWQEHRRIEAGGLEGPPGELGPLQVLAASLQVRFRAEVAGRRFDEALRTAKTMFALARHLGEHPSEVADLVGLWAAHLGFSTLEEMVQQPGCPNLFWALTDLPCPLVDLRKGIQGDRIRVAGELRPIRDDGPMTEAELKAFVGRLAAVQSLAREQAGRAPLSPRSGLQGRLQAAARDSERVRAARRRLVEAGSPEDRVKQFPPAQVILLDAKREFEVQRDERLKLLAVPLWQIDGPADVEGRDQADALLFAELLPQVVELRRAQARLEQQIALLRHVEALRLYAAIHPGRLPEKLSEIQVPLPVDPVAGRPFDYQAEGATAHLRGASSPGEAGRAGSDVHYVVTVRK
jgi:hypothetical protein